MFQDSVFMMPHLGVLSTVYKEAAWSIFDKDCLVRLGTNIAAAGTGRVGEPVMKVEMKMPDGEVIEEDLKLGDIKLIQLPERQEEARAVITPTRGFDMGEGPGHKIESTIMGGVVGVMLDARGRPLSLPAEEGERKEMLLKWFDAMDLYPEEDLKELL